MARHSSFCRPNPAFRESVEIGTSRWKDEGPDASRVQEAPEGGAELAVPVMDEKASAGQKAPVGHGDVAGDLLHPLLVGVRCQPGNVDLPAGEVDEEEDVVGNQSLERPDLCREEVGGGRCSCSRPVPPLDPLQAERKALGLVVGNERSNGAGRPNGRYHPRGLS